MRSFGSYFRGIIRWVIACAGVFVVLACSGSSSPTAPSSAGRVETMLRVGESVQVSSSATIRFDKVVGDSRCPTGAVCVWAGEATVELTLADSSGSETFRLTTLTNQTIARGFPVRLLSVEPYPVLNSEIPPGTYRISLRVGD